MSNLTGDERAEAVTDCNELPPLDVTDQDRIFAAPMSHIMTKREALERYACRERQLLAAQTSHAALMEKLKGLRSWVEDYRADGVRPDEWTLQEWVAKCDEILEGK